MTTVNNRTLSGVISISDGAGSTMEDGQIVTDRVDTGHLLSNTSEIGDMDIDRLLLQEHLNVNSTLITPTWLSYLFGLTGNIQNQINSISSTILGTANTWTNIQTFSGNVVNMIFEKTSTNYPVQTSNTIGAIYATASDNKALTFMNSSNNYSISTKAFVFSKQDSASSAVELGALSNNGTLTLAGNINSPTITSINSSLAGKQNIIDASNRLNANLIGSTGNVSNTMYDFLSGVTSNIQSQFNTITSTLSGYAVLANPNTWLGINRYDPGSQILIASTTTTQPFPAWNSSNAGAIMCRGVAPQTQTMCFYNANTGSNPASQSFSFAKMTSASTVLQQMTIFHNGDVTIPSGLLTASAGLSVSNGATLSSGVCNGRFNTRLIQQNVTRITNTGTPIVYTWTTLTSVIYKTTSRSIELPQPDILDTYTGVFLWVIHQGSGLTTTMTVTNGSNIRIATGLVTSYTYTGGSMNAAILMVQDTEWVVVGTN